MSKIAREIAALLLAHNCVLLSRGNQATEIIDKVLAGKTIKKSAYDHLKRVEKDYYSSFDFVTVGRLQDEIADFNIRLVKAINRIAELEAELNQYRQAEEVESKLDEFLAVSNDITEYTRGFKDGQESAAKQAEVNRKVDEYNAMALGPSVHFTSSPVQYWNGVSWSWTSGKDSDIPLPAEVKPEPSSVTEQPVESASKFRDFLSCIGFKC